MTERLTPVRGLLMGLADAVPGVSGGTVALMLGIHPRLVHAIASLEPALVGHAWAARRSDGRARFTDHARRTDLGFLALLGLGIASGLLLGAKLLVRFLDAEPQMAAAFFLALIATGVTVPLRHAEASWRGLAIGAAAAAFAYVLTVVPLLQGEPPMWALPALGALAACAMILPGISGAYLLLLLGAYPVIIHAVAELDLVVLGLTAIGAVLGLLAFSRFLRRLLSRHSGPTHAAMVGLMVGSVGRLWPWRTEAAFAAGVPTAVDAATVPAVMVGAVLGLLVGVLLAMAAKKA